MRTPVRCTVEPGALRVLAPRNRPGVPRPSRRWTWSGSASWPGGTLRRARRRPPFLRTPAGDRSLGRSDLNRVRRRGLVVPCPQLQPDEQTRFGVVEVDPEERLHPGQAVPDSVDVHVQRLRGVDRVSAAAEVRVDGLLESLPVLFVVGLDLQRAPRAVPAAVNDETIWRSCRREPRESSSATMSSESAEIRPSETLRTSSDKTSSALTRSPPAGRSSPPRPAPPGPGVREAGGRLHNFQERGPLELA